jgi:hypothetical protein
VIDLIKELLVPANRQILYIVLYFLAVILAFAMAVIAYFIHKGTFTAGRKIGPIYIQVRAASAVDQFARKSSGYRKLLYIKVTHLSQQTATASPIYTRILDRLEPSERQVAVYDEAVYYTLELFPSSAPRNARSDSSSGPVDARMVIPWQDKVRFQQDTAAAIAKIAQMDVTEPTDTVLTISHFENGVQTKEHQNVKTLIEEDAEEVRLVIDFSSIPGAQDFVTLENAFLDRKADNASQSVGGSPITRTLFVASTKDGKKGDVLRLNFNIDWTKAPRPTA